MERTTPVGLVFAMKAAATDFNSQAVRSRRSRPRGDLRPALLRVLDGTPFRRVGGEQVRGFFRLPAEKSAGAVFFSIASPGWVKLPADRALFGWFSANRPETGPTRPAQLSERLAPITSCLDISAMSAGSSRRHQHCYTPGREPRWQRGVLRFGRRVFPSRWPRDSRARCGSARNIRPVSGQLRLKIGTLWHIADECCE